MIKANPNAARVGSGNLYIGNRDPAAAIRVAAATGALSFGYSEGGNAEQHVTTQPGYVGVADLSANDDPQDANDCLIMVRKRLHVRAHGMTQVCEDVPDSKVGHARRAAYVAYDVPEWDGATLFHLQVHPNWVQGLDSANHPVVREMLRSLAGYDALLTYAKAMGWHRVVTGDFNVRKGEKKPYDTIYTLLGDHRMVSKAEGLDGVARDRGIVLDAWHTIPGSRVGSDHDKWTVADLRLGRR